MSQDKLQDVSILRSIAVVSLVVWHSYCAYVCWGMADTPLNAAYTILFKTIFPDANMPLFTFISGYLFCFLLVNKGKYQSFKPFVLNKVHRLLIPYLVLGFVINMTQIDRQNPYELFVGAPNHMWYCLMLFYCFIVCWLVEKKVGSRTNIVLMVLSFLLVLVAGEKNIVRIPLGIYMPIYYYGYFYLGFIIFKHKDVVLNFSKKYFFLLSILFATFSTLFFGIEKYGTHFLLMKSTLFILLALALANSEFVQRKIYSVKGVSKCIELLGKYSFGIYVFHQWIIWNVTRCSQMQSVIQNHYVIFPLALFLIVLGMSFLLTHLSMKTKIGRYLFS